MQWDGDEQCRASTKWNALNFTLNVGQIRPENISKHSFVSNVPFGKLQTGFHMASHSSLLNCGTFRSFPEPMASWLFPWLMPFLPGLELLFFNNLLDIHIWGCFSITKSSLIFFPEPLIAPSSSGPGLFDTEIAFTQVNSIQLIMWLPNGIPFSGFPVPFSYWL